MRVILKNDFHNTRAEINAKDGIITQRQCRRARKELCGFPDCLCGGGFRGRQDFDFEWDDDNGVFFLRVS